MKIEYRKESRFKGIAVSPGVACGKTCLFNENRHAGLAVYYDGDYDSSREKVRVERAFRLAAAQLETLRRDVAHRIGEAEGKIFAAQISILNDGQIADSIAGKLERGKLNAETAVTLVMDEYEQKLMKLDNEYLRDRATDIGEIKRRVLDNLADLNPSLQCAGQEHCQRGRNRIIVAEELTPTLTVDLDAGRVLGFVTERGGKTSHAAILARALGIPAVTGLAGIHGALNCGTEILVDGNTGEVVVWPTEATRQAMLPAKGAPAGAPPTVRAIPGLSVMANISLARDAESAMSAGAEGIGLYRTEFEFFAANRLLTEDEQAARYVSVLKSMGDRNVSFRLLDVGGDKSEPFLGISAEQNPYLGLRGARFLLSRPDLLGCQARALARASEHKPVHVLYPMIVDLRQFKELRRIFMEAIRGMRQGVIFHGVMFEVPSACLQARELLDAGDFGSIGTNDLVQYLFAVDRNNALVSSDYSPDHTVFWALLEQLRQTAGDLKKPISVCGELAGDPVYARKLMEIGFDTVSVSAKLIPVVRQAVLAAKSGAASAL